MILISRKCGINKRAQLATQPTEQLFSIHLAPSNHQILDDFETNIERDLRNPALSWSIEFNGFTIANKAKATNKAIITVLSQFIVV